MAPVTAHQFALLKEIDVLIKRAVIFHHVDVDLHTRQKKILDRMDLLITI